MQGTKSDVKQKKKFLLLICVTLLLYVQKTSKDQKNKKVFTLSLCDGKQGTKKFFGGRSKIQNKITFVLLNTKKL